MRLWSGDVDVRDTLVRIRTMETELLLHSKVRCSFQQDAQIGTTDSSVPDFEVKK